MCALKMKTVHFYISAATFKFLDYRVQVFQQVIFLGLAG